MNSLPRRPSPSLPRPCAPSAPRLETLPADIIVLILRLLPLVPRVRVVSRLSKHVNALVYRSVDEVSHEVHHSALQCLSGDVLARLPSLTNLQVHMNGQDLVLPTTLRTLHIVSSGSEALRSRFPAPLPLVTSLSLSLFGSQDGVTDVITKVAASLKKLFLFINMSRGPQGPLAECISAIHLPQLAQLSIAFTNADNAALLAFLRRHGPQLKSLGFIHPPRPASLISDVTLPNLTELHSAPSDMMHGLAARCPKLTALHANHPNVPTDLPLVSLSVDRSIDPHQVTCLPLHKRLAAIRHVEMDECIANALAEHGVAHLAESCDLRGSPSVAFLSAATRLTSLTIRYNLLCADTPLVFPSLTELTLRPAEEHSGVFTEEVACLQRFLPHCPRLAHITLSQCGDLTDAQETLADLVRELNARSTVRILEVEAADGDDLVSFAASLSPPWLNVRVDAYPRWGDFL